MDDNSVYLELVRIIGESFPEQEASILREMRLVDLAGWDSFSFVELILSVQQAFGVKIQSRELDRLSRVHDLVHVITSQLHSVPERSS